MILKFKNGTQWVIFGEIDHVVYGPPDETDMPEDSVNYEDEHNENRLNRIEFFTKNMTAATVLYAHSPVYLMNDQGRTVETI